MHNNNNNNIETFYDVLAFGDSIVMYKLYAYGYVASYVYALAMGKSSYRIEMLKSSSYIIILNAYYVHHLYMYFLQLLTLSLRLLQCMYSINYMHAYVAIIILLIYL